MKKHVLGMLLGLLCTGSLTAAEWGGISGQVIVNGDVPERVLLHAKGAPIKDAEVCAAADTYTEDVIVDKDSKGLANVFVYLAKAPKEIHPDLKEPTAKTVLFDQKGCAFLPHALIVRKGQSVDVISSDGVAHNTHTYPVKNNAVNVVISPNTASPGTLVPCSLGERLPIQVKCDYHPWMIAYWMIVDHPYAAITDKDGKFKIENMPVGDHELVIWHEKVGYVERKYKVSVKKGAVAELKPVTLDVKKLTDKK
jgi:plastocyanin